MNDKGRLVGKENRGVGDCVGMGRKFGGVVALVMDSKGQKVKFRHRARRAKSGFNKTINEMK
jgi:hypothetical protein